MFDALNHCATSQNHVLPPTDKSRLSSFSQVKEVESFQQHLSDSFIFKDDAVHHDVSQILKKMRTKNLHNVIVGLLNVNSIASEFDAIKSIIPGSIGVVIVCETKLDDSYPTAQFVIEGFKKPFGLDRD